MKLLPLFILFPFSIQGQNLSQVNKIIFAYRIGHYNFGDTGRYEREEIHEFLRVADDRFSRNGLAITKRYVEDPVTKKNQLSIQDTVKSKSGRTFSVSAFQNLFDHLNKTGDHFQKDDLLPLLSTIRKKEILSVAKKCNSSFWFIDEETGRMDHFGKQRVKRIKRLDFVDSFFLVRKPNLEFETIVTDVWNRLTVSFYTQADTIKYRFQFFELLGQPFSKTINSEYSRRERMVNSAVNRLLLEFLPRKTLTAKAIGAEKLKEEYVKWYIENKML